MSKVTYHFFAIGNFKNFEKITFLEEQITKIGRILESGNIFAKYDMMISFLRQNKPILMTFPKNGNILTFCSRNKKC